MSVNRIPHPNAVAYYSGWHVCVDENLSDYGSTSIRLCQWGAEVNFEQACRDMRMVAASCPTGYVTEMRVEFEDALDFEVIPRERWEIQKAA